MLPAATPDDLGGTVTVQNISPSTNAVHVRTTPIVLATGGTSPALIDGAEQDTLAAAYATRRYVWLGDHWTIER